MKQGIHPDYKNVQLNAFVAMKLKPALLTIISQLKFVQHVILFIQDNKKFLTLKVV